MNYKKILICALFIFLGFHMQSIRTIAMQENQTEQVDLLLDQTIQKLILQGNSGDTEAQFQLGTYYYERQDYHKSIMWYELAAKKGHVYAQFNLGICYNNLETPNYEKAHKYFLLAAEQGLAEAQFHLGSFYEYHTSDKIPNYEQALKWYRLAAKQYYSPAQCSLGSCFFYGKGVQQNYETAIMYFKLAAIQDDAEAQYNLGICYDSGQGVAQNYQLAVKWYTLSANQGYMYAQYNLGTCYDLGQGVSQDPYKAFQLYAAAALQGHPDAQYNLGVCYEAGQGTQQDFQNAIICYEAAANQDCVEAQFNLGICYMCGKGVDIDFKKAISLYTTAAENGSVKAQSYLGLCYEMGHCGVKQNFQEAAKWYTLAASQGLADAQYKLGEFYNSGHGVTQNFQEAFKWYSMSAAQGYMHAQYKLGTFYHEGKIIPQNFQVASIWYKLAAKQEHTDAQYILGCYYETGMEGVPKNLKKAFDYYTTASIGGHAKSRWKLGKFYYFGLCTKKSIETAAFWFHSAYTKEPIWTASHRFANPTNVQIRIVDLCNQLNSIRWKKTPVSIFLNRYLRKHLGLINFLTSHGIAKIANGKILLNSDELKKPSQDPHHLNMLLLEATDVLKSARSISLFERIPDNVIALDYLNTLLSNKPYILGKKDQVILCDKFFIPYAKSEWRSYPVSTHWFEDYMILANMYGVNFTPGLIHFEQISKNENIYDYIFGNTGKYPHRLHSLSANDGGLMRHLLAREMYWLRCMNEKYTSGTLSDKEKKAFETCKSLIETHFVSANGACSNELADIIILWASDIDACEEEMGIGIKICDQNSFNARLFTWYKQQLAEKILSSAYLETLMKKGISTDPIQNVYKSIMCEVGPEFRNFYRIIIADLLHIIPSIGNSLAIDRNITREDIESILSDAIHLTDICCLAQGLYQNLTDEKEAQEKTSAATLTDENTTTKSNEAENSEKADDPLCGLPIKERLALEIERKYKISRIDFCKIVDQTCSGNFLKRLNEFLSMCLPEMNEDAEVYKKNIDEWINGNIMLTVSKLVNIIVQLDPYFKHTEIIPELARFNTTIGCKSQQAAEYYGKVLYPIYLLKEGFIGID